MGLEPDFLKTSRNRNYLWHLLKFRFPGPAVTPYGKIITLDVPLYIINGRLIFLLYLIHLILIIQHHMYKQLILLPDKVSVNDNIN